MPTSLSIEIFKDEEAPLYIQIADALRVHIADGRLRPADRLPSVRRLSDQLGVNPATIVSAYSILAREGLLESRKGSGAYVAESAASAQTRPLAPLSGFSHDVLDNRLPADSTDAILDLAANAPPRQLFPLEEVKHLLVQAVDLDGGRAFEYQDANGYAPLRDALADRLSAHRPYPVHPDNLHIVSGAQQGIDLVSRVVLRRGDLALVESPGYRGVRDVFVACGARVEAVPVGVGGPDLDLIRRMAETRPLRLVYVNPVLQNPTGASWPEEAKRELAAMAKRYGFYVLEDDLFSDLMYDGHVELPVKYYDKSDLVFYIKSFSKSLMPGLRIAVVQAPAVLQERLSSAKQAVDLSSSGLMQRVLEQFVSGKLYDRHLARVQRSYSGLAGLCAERLAAEGFSEQAREIPAGGLNWWFRVPEHCESASQLARRLAGLGVLAAPEAQFRNELPPGEDRHLRLSFGSLDSESLIRGIGLLGQAAGQT